MLVLLCYLSGFTFLKYATPSHTTLDCFPGSQTLRLPLFLALLIFTLKSIVKILEMNKSIQLASFFS